ncbi:MAG TPA: helix-turn-helix transcriptional regulator [Opitutaceae bacterium]|nr:helix-turn-helix transcriptional regulator [Opitutaceae bacterium]
MKNKLRELRAAREWSQGDLAEKLSVSRQTINAIETEKYDPSLPLAFKIAKLFKLPVEEIFEA